MPKLTGIFEQFKYLDQIPMSDIIRWVPKTMETTQIENFVGNRILYPQTLPINRIEMEIDLAILREAVRRQPEVFLDATQKKFLISESVGNRFGQIENLIKALIEALSPKGVTQIYTKNEEQIKLVGSVITPSVVPNELVINASINNQSMGLRGGSVIFLPFKDQKLIVKIGDSKEQMLASGGELGLVIDLRVTGTLQA